MPLASRGSSFERARAELAERLRSRQGEIEAAVLTRAFAVSDTGEPLDLSSWDPEYLEGLRAAISAAVDWGLAVIEAGEERAPSPPPILLAQARLAARHGVGLDTVLRRYSAGYILLTDFLFEEAEASGVRGPALKRLLRAQAALDRLLAAVGEEYAREASQRPGTTRERRAERIERLLAGELLDTSGLEYDFEATHLALIASGPGVPEALRGLAAALDCRLLALPREEGTTWAWLGSRCGPQPQALLEEARATRPPELLLAIGEPGQGLAGWRFSHRQAAAAMTVARRSPEALTRYADVALLAAVLKDELLATSLRELYLEPLEAERDGGEVAFETLRAYFAAGRNVSSAAVELGVKRHTITNRLRALEGRIGRPLDACPAQLETALALRALERSP